MLGFGGKGIIIILSPLCGVLFGAAMTAGIGMLLMKKRCTFLKMTGGIMDTVMGKRRADDCCGC